MLLHTNKITGKLVKGKGNPRMAQETTTRVFQGICLIRSITMFRYQNRGQTGLPHYRTGNVRPILSALCWSQM